MTRKRRPPWYQEGLQFECQRSGNCCTGPSGRVWFDPAELQRMASRLGLLPFQFLERYAHRLDGRYSLREIEVGEDAFDCVFLARDEQGNGGCAIYADRPAQCRTWPFWRDNLKSEAEWERAARGCPGMNRGRVFGVEEIEERRDETPRD